MGRHILQRHIWGYSVCLCPIKRTPGLYGLIIIDLMRVSLPARSVFVICQYMVKWALSKVGLKLGLCPGQKLTAGLTSTKNKNSNFQMTKCDIFSYFCSKT